MCKKINLSGYLHKEKAKPVNTKHELSKTKGYCMWNAMIQRCTNPKSNNYSNYGGRGIDICTHWLILENFLKDIGDIPNGLTIERINNNLGYSPSNCKLATYIEQNRNQRLRKTNTTGVAGVCWVKKRQKYQANIRVNYKRIHLGYFSTVETAKDARIKAEQKYWRQDAGI